MNLFKVERGEVRAFFSEIRRGHICQYTSTCILLCHVAVNKSHCHRCNVYYVLHVCVCVCVCCTATSTGHADGVDNMYQGACYYDNMKLTVRVCCGHGQLTYTIEIK